MWTLVFIIIVETEVTAYNVGTYDTMYECFANWEQLGVTAGGEKGYYPANTQAVCVKRESDL